MYGENDARSYTCRVLIGGHSLRGTAFFISPPYPVRFGRKKKLKSEWLFERARPVARHVQRQIKKGDINILISFKKMKIRKWESF